MTGVHDFGEPLKLVLQRRVRREDGAMYYRIEVELNGEKHSLDFCLPDDCHKFDTESIMLYVTQRLGSLLRPWLMEMIEKTAR